MTNAPRRSWRTGRREGAAARARPEVRRGNGAQRQRLRRHSEIIGCNTSLPVSHATLTSLQIDSSLDSPGEIGAMNLVLCKIASLSLGGLIFANQIAAAEPVVIDLMQWRPPDIAEVGDDPFAKLVKYGHALFTDTANEIGPAVPDASKRFPGTILLARTAIYRPARSPMPCLWSGYGANFRNTAAAKVRWTRSKNGSTGAWSAA